MNRQFNVTGSCDPQTDYMVDTSAKIDVIIDRLVSRGKYFTINRARQYGKTTTLSLLEERLSGEYIALNISFEGSDGWFRSFSRFNQGFCSELKSLLTEKGYSSLAQSLDEASEEDIPEDIFRHRISTLCSAARKPIVLMIDEVDRATDYAVFATFLGILRKMFLNRKKTPAFYSVILAGVHDVKNLKKKIRPDSGHSYNSPWNIASYFDVDMSFSAAEIQGMLRDYEGDHHTGMDTAAVASRIRFHTGGYPFLVSRLCMIMDETSLEWSPDGVDGAETRLLLEENTLFDDMYKNVLGNAGLRDLLESVLLRGANFDYSPGNPVISLGMMYGILSREGNRSSLRRASQTC